jgi:hypothetical protein
MEKKDRTDRAWIEHIENKRWEEFQRAVLQRILEIRATNISWLKTDYGLLRSAIGLING